MKNADYYMKYNLIVQLSGNRDSHVIEYHREVLYVLYKSKWYVCEIEYSQLIVK